MGENDMRLQKRATLIAKSLRKLIEDGGGSAPQLALVEVRLPVAVFDLICGDSGAPDATEIRVDGVMFKRDGSASKAGPKRSN
jgi:hypothetical protein